MQWETAPTSKGRYCAFHRIVGTGTFSSKFWQILIMPSFRFFNVSFFTMVQISNWSNTIGCWREMVSRAKFLAIVKMISSSLAWTSQSSGGCFRTLAARRRSRRRSAVGSGTLQRWTRRAPSGPWASLNSLSTTSPSNFLPELWPILNLASWRLTRGQVVKEIAIAMYQKYATCQQCM